MNNDAQQEQFNTACENSHTSLINRIDALEAKLAFQDDWIETLDQLVRDQAATIDKLTRTTTLIYERLGEQRQQLDDLGGQDSQSTHEIPPHY